MAGGNKNGGKNQIGGGKIEMAGKKSKWQGKNKNGGIIY